MIQLIQSWSGILIPIGLFLLIVLLGYSLWRFGWNIFERWADKTQWTGNIAIINTVRVPSFLWVVIIALVVSTEFSPIPEYWSSIVEKSLWTVLLLSIIWVFIRMGDKVIKVYTSRMEMPSTYLTLARQALLVLLVVVMALTALSIWGVPTNAALLGIGILVLVLFLVLRDVLSDIFTGLEITATGTVKKRDYIKLSTGEEGHVMEIGIRSTKIKMRDENIATISNSRLQKTIVTNYGQYSMKPEYDRLKDYADKIEALSRELANQRDRIQAILSSLAEGIFVLDNEGKIISLNPAAEQILQSSSAEIVGNNIDKYINVSPSELLKIMNKQDEDPTHIIKKHFHNKVLSLNVQSVHEREDQEGNIVLAVHDITELDRLDQMKTEFVSMVSHELRTPITSIKGYIEMILNGEAGQVNNEQHGYLEVVQNSTDKLMILVNDLLDISRIEAGRIELKLKKISLKNVIQSVINTVQKQIDEKELKVEIQMPDEDIKVLADNVRLSQILTNLISNTCKYTDKDGKISISTHPVDNFVQVDIKDNGIGISEEDQSRIFTRFFRVDNSLTRKTGGTGLGLSITKSLVEMQGGKIWVASNPGEGSTFSCTIPLAK